VDEKAANDEERAGTAETEQAQRPEKERKGNRLARRVRQVFGQDFNESEEDTAPGEWNGP
jgi:hypothetical protein